MSAKMITLLFILWCCASWTMAQSSPAPGHAASPDRDTARCDRDSVGTTFGTTDSSARQPEWIVAERDFTGQHPGLEFSGTSYAWHQRVAFDGEPEYDEQSWRVSVRHAPGKRRERRARRILRLQTQALISLPQTPDRSRLRRIQVRQIRFRRTRPATLRERHGRIQ